MEYMKQDIYLLGGIMKRVQEIDWSSYKIDIVKKMTLSALALEILRIPYSNVSKYPISIPTTNEDGFIRRAYSGGHTDVY